MDTFHVEQPEDSGHILDHAVAHHGLMHMFTKTGSSNLQDPEKHHKHLDKAKSHLAEGNHEKAVDLLHGHPMAGGTGKNHLEPIVQKLSPNIQSQELSPDALKAAIDHLTSAARGQDKIASHSKAMFDKKKFDVDHDDKSVASLKEHLQALEENPAKLLDLGEHLGHYLPSQSAQLGFQAVTAVNYLNSIKPRPSQGAPFDTIVPPSKSDEAAYDRQLSIAQNPTLVLKHAKEGMIQPSDLVTLHTLYPKLAQSMMSEVGAQVIEAHAKGRVLSGRERQGLSLLLDQPLDSTQTPEAMRAIMKSAAGQQTQQKSKTVQAPPKKATDVELKQINKTNALYETDLEARAIDKREK